MADTNGSTRNTVASFLQNIEMGVRNDKGQVDWVAPNRGQYPLAHVATFQSVVTTQARTYRESDEAIRASLDNARFMRNDVGIMECLESRQRCTALLNWHIEPEDDKSQEQKDLAAEMTKIMKCIPRFTEYRRVLLEALWYGKYAIQHQYGWQQIGGKMRCLPTPGHPGEYGWKPINGDKIVFRFEDPDLPAGAFPGQMGIRVNTSRWGVGQLINKRWKVESIAATERGMAYFLSKEEMKLLALHRHMVEDAAFEDMKSAGFLNGVGIRSRIYWEWVQKQETLRFLMEYLERSAGGIELWHFPSGNKDAKDQVKEAALNRLGNSRNIMLVPIPAGEDGNQYGCQIIEPGMAGVDLLKDLLERYFGHRIKRYILGQTLTSEADATGLGSGVADAHIDTLMQIVTYDATNLEETITQHTLRPMQGWNFPKSRNIRLRFVIRTEDEDMAEKLEAYQKAWTMGARLRAKDVMDMIGAAMPMGDEEVLSNQGQQGQEMGQPQQQQQEPGIPSKTSVSVPGMPEAAPVDQNSAQQQPANVERYSKRHEYSSTQFDIADGDGDGDFVLRAIRQMVQAIPDDELADDGREMESHVTVLFGLHADTADEVARVASNFRPVTITFGETSLFHASEGKNYDVVKIDIEGDDIHELHDLLAELEHTSTWPDYKPHLTLAYVRPGEGQKYVGPNAITGLTMTFERLQFSDKNRDKMPVLLPAERVFSSDVDDDTRDMLQRADETLRFHKTAEGWSVYRATQQS